MKNFLLAFKKYSFEYLKYIATRLPVWVIGFMFAYMMLTSPPFSREQYGWLLVYTFVAVVYTPTVKIIKNIVENALRDEE